MRAKFDKSHGKTRAELSGADRKVLGRAVEVLTNLQVCEQVDAEAPHLAAGAITYLQDIGTAYPEPKGDS